MLSVACIKQMHHRHHHQPPPQKYTIEDDEGKDGDSGIVRLVQTVLKYHPTAALTPDASGYIPLHHYCSNNNNNTNTNHNTNNNSRRNTEQPPPHSSQTTITRTLIWAAPKSLWHAAHDGKRPLVWPGKEEEEKTVTMRTMRMMRTMRTRTDG
jgi:hypothetical protein